MSLSHTGSYSHTYIRVIYRSHGLTRTSHIGILCHDICILDIHKHSCQACIHSAIIYIYSQISIQHI
ncbi:hypothetical protein F383_37541 [Gossypium arboreum]|uniref:Uncharacterized protein n=1 Tax=Gossypium arboreum TaxID=29729 RepID=A0A0B0MDM1_GOSAR|nr:hypothetical protein F383_37541 [Gossypium arboreum]